MRIIGKCLLGSQNYLLHNSDSDKDYKIFMAPEFIDLYNGKDKPTLPIGYDPEHNSAMDFRKFDSLLRRGNANIVEYLFSSNFELYDNDFADYFTWARIAFEKGYVAHIWNYFFASAKGLVLNSLKRMDSSEELRRKAAARGVWWINFLSYIIKDDYRISERTWTHPSVWTFPREIRYNGHNFALYNAEDWQEMFEYLEIMAINTKCTTEDYLFQTYDNLLTKCARNTIANAIRKELEGIQYG